MIRRLSLHARLLFLLALLLAMLWAGLEIAARKAAQDRADAELLEELRATTDLLIAVSVPEGLDAGERRALLETVQIRRRAPIGQGAYELVDGDAVILRSALFPDLAAAPPPGIATVQAEGDTWHVLTSVDLKTGTTRRAALSDTSRDRRAHDLLADLTAPWAIALPLFAIAVLGSVWLGLRPLRQIERRMAAISPYAPEPLGLDSARMPRELGTLARSFDGLADRLARVISDQRIFASAASHELHTPLAGALSQLDVLRRAPGRRASMDRLGDALSHMQRLLAQLLFLARSDTVAGSERPEPVDLAALAQAVGTELDLGSRLAIDGAGAVTGHPDLLRSLLRNLLRNAAQARADEPIRVEIGESQDSIHVEVLDRGPGIPDAERHAILEPFRRGSGSQARGAGLGLTVAQRIAELHGGRIAIAGRAGGGASVTAILARSPGGIGA